MQPSAVLALSLLVVAVRAGSESCETVDEETLKCTLDEQNLDGAAELSGLTKHLDIVCGKLSAEAGVFNASFLAGFQSLETLSIHQCKLSEIKRGTFRHLRSLKEFSIRTSTPGWSSPGLVMEPGCFMGLDNLEVLDISGNNIWTMESQLLVDLKSLKTLNISRNTLRSLVDLKKIEVSDGLQVLDVSSNGIVDLTTADTSDLRNLREFYMSSNQLAAVHDGALRNFRLLEVLDVSNNQLVDLPAMLLNETRQLRELRVQDNNIRVLPPGLFSDLTQLLTVNMSNNELSSQWIRKDTFAGLFRLIVLDLSGNQLDSLSLELFQDLSSLQILDLSRNQVQVLPAGLFATLSNLHTLSLSDNMIKQVGRHLLRGLRVLSRLSLDGNLLTDIDNETFTNVSSIQELRLQRNHLINVPSAISPLTALKHLDLGDNYIGEVTADFLQPLKQLSLLRLAGNGLTSFPPQFLAGSTSLAMLDLSNNELTSLESGTFESTPNLRALRLDANHVKNINGLFAKLSSLVWLNASDNQIEFFDYALIPAELRWLDLHNNQIKEIGNFYDLGSVMKLETFDISFNQITHLNTLSVPDGIKYFIAAGNHLESVEPGTFATKSQVIRVDLSGNQLSQLDLNAVVLPGQNGTESAAELLIAGNPFFCDCGMDWLLNIDSMTPRSRYPKVVDTGRIMCRLLHSPNHLTPLQKTKPSDFLCIYERHCFALCHCCNYVACDCEMKCPDGCSCYHDHTWDTNIVDCSNREQLAISREIPMDATAVFADGNNIRSVDSHTFIGRKRIRYLYVNGSNVEEIQNRSLNGLTDLQVLRLENNLITELHGYEFDTLQSLRELYLHNNRISKIHPGTFSNLRSLEVLTLSNNKLTSFPVWQLTSNPYLVQVSLANNPWSCECNFLSQLTEYLSNNQAKVADTIEVQCVYEGEKPDCGPELAKSTVQRAESSNVLLLALISGAVVAIAAVALGVAFRFRQRLCRKQKDTSRRPSYMDTVAVAAVTPEVEKLYDVFVTYSAQDIRFVNEVLAPELEHSTPSYRLCLLRRDAPDTSYLGDAVHHCVQTSRKTLLVVSRNFLDNEWCRFDFKASHLDALKGRGGIVAVLYGVDRSAVEGELKLLLKGAACVSYGEQDFWRKLRSLLPPYRGFRSTIPRSVSHQSYAERSVKERELLQTVLPGESPSPTCSSVLSEDRSDCPIHIRSDSSKPLVSNVQPLHNCSYSTIGPSEHTYMSIDHYHTPGHMMPSAPAPDLYSGSLEPGINLRVHPDSEYFRHY